MDIFCLPLGKEMTLKNFTKITKSLSGYIHQREIPHPLCEYAYAFLQLQPPLYVCLLNGLCPDIVYKPAKQT